MEAALGQTVKIIDGGKLPLIGATAKPWLDAARASEADADCNS